MNSKVVVTKSKERSGNKGTGKVLMSMLGGEGNVDPSSNQAI